MTVHVAAKQGNIGLADTAGLEQEACSGGGLLGQGQTVHARGGIVELVHVSELGVLGELAVEVGVHRVNSTVAGLVDDQVVRAVVEDGDEHGGGDA